MLSGGIGDWMLEGDVREMDVDTGTKKKKGTLEIVGR